MNTEKMRIKIAEFCGRKWIWRVVGSSDDGFTWGLFLALPPEEGVGVAWKGCAGETRLATPEEIAKAIESGEYQSYNPNYPSDLNAIFQALKDKGLAWSIECYDGKYCINIWGEEPVVPSAESGVELGPTLCKAFIKACMPGQWEESTD